MKVLLFANTDWYLYNFRASLAVALRKRGYQVVLVSPPGPYGSKLRSLGLDWVPIPMMRRSLNPFREAQLLVRLVRILMKERPDVVHGFTIKCAVYGSLASWLIGVPGRVSSVAGLGYVFISSTVLARLLRPLVGALLKLALGGKRSRLILQNSDDVGVFVQAGLVDPRRIRLIAGSGVDCGMFAPSQVSSDRARLRVLLPARLLWDKGLAEYVQAGKILLGRNVDVELLLAGLPDPGNPASVPLAEVHTWVSEGLINWLGHVDDMPGLMKTADLVVLPSYREGLPRGLIEGAASGCALIATDVPGCREVVNHEIDGLLVPARDGQALADAIERLVVDAPLRTKLSLAAREKAIMLFDQRKIVDETIDVYEEFRPRKRAA